MFLLKAIEVQVRDESGQWVDLVKFAFPNPIDSSRGYRIMVIPSSIAENTDTYESHASA